jgi:hypothetical protein
MFPARTFERRVDRRAAHLLAHQVGRRLVVDDQRDVVVDDVPQLRGERPGARRLAPSR